MAVSATRTNDTAQAGIDAVTKQQAALAEKAGDANVASDQVTRALQAVLDAVKKSLDQAGDKN